MMNLSSIHGVKDMINASMKGTRSVLNGSDVMMFDYMWSRMVSWLYHVLCPELLHSSACSLLQWKNIGEVFPLALMEENMKKSQRKTLETILRCLLCGSYCLL